MRERERLWGLSLITNSTRLTITQLHLRPVVLESNLLVTSRGLGSSTEHGGKCRHWRANLSTPVPGIGTTSSLPFYTIYNLAYYSRTYHKWSFVSFKSFTYCFFVNRFSRGKTSSQSGDAENKQMEKQNEASQTIVGGVTEVFKWRMCQCANRSIQTTSSCPAGQQIRTRIYWRHLVDSVDTDGEIVCRALPWILSGSVTFPFQATH